LINDVKDENFRGEDGNYVRRAGDQAIYLPVLSKTKKRGSSQPIPEFLQTLHDQIHIAGCRGNATGRNIHQRSLGDAVKLCDAIHAITNEDVSVEKALSIINS
jgi:DhnA family fructose-bisphosphate aldolase class Ia